MFDATEQGIRIVSHSEAIQRLAREFWRIAKVPHDPPTKTFLEKCQSRTIEVNGKFHEYYQSGTGPTVLLVHGVHSNLGSMVPIAETLLEQDYQVVLFDAPSHGEASGTSTDPVEVSRLIRAMYDRLTDLHAVVCHSLGGLWALAAWNNDVRAKTLVSISSPATMTFLVDKFVEMAKIDGDQVPELVRQLEGRVGEGVWTEYSPSEAVKTISIPGLIIHGTSDDFIPQEHAERLHSRWDRSTLELIQDARHFDILRSPEVRKIISAYLQEVM